MLRLSEEYRTCGCDAVLPDCVDQAAWDASIKAHQAVCPWWIKHLADHAERERRLSVCDVEEAGPVQPDMIQPDLFGRR